MAKKAANNAHIVGAHRLLFDSLRFMRLHAKKLGGVLIVAVVVNLLINFSLGAETASLYQSIWFVMVSCALVWTIRHLDDKEVKVTFAQAYYTGTAPALRFFLTLIVIGLASLPFSIGAFVYSVVNAATSGSSAAEKIIAGLVWLGLALVTLVILARAAFSLLIVTLPGVRPMQSLKLSWRLSHGKVNAIVARMAIFSLYFGTAAVLVLVGVSFIPIPSGLSQLILSLLGMLVVLPLVYIYLYHLYRAIK